MREFLVYSAGSPTNRGCWAITKETLRILKDEFDGCRCEMVALDADWYREVMPGVTFVPQKPRMMTPDWLHKRVMRALGRHEDADAIDCRQFIRRPERFDAIVLMAADIYSEDYGGVPSYLYAVGDACRNTSLPMMLWAVSVGPFSDAETERRMAAEMNSMDMILARETVTLEYLQQIGVTTEIRLTADPAFLLEPQEPTAVTERMDLRQPYVGLNISPLMFNNPRRRQLPPEELAATLGEFVDHIAGTSGTRVVLVPHVVGRSGVDGDYRALERVREHASDPDALTLVPGTLSPNEYKWIIGRSEVFIGARTHTQIAALSSGVPTMALTYSPKGVGISRDMLGHEDYVLRMADVEGGGLRETFDQLWARREDDRNTLAERVPVMKERARENGQHLRDLLE